MFVLTVRNDLKQMLADPVFFRLTADDPYHARLSHLGSHVFLLLDLIVIILSVIHFRKGLK